ncbi:MAG: helix-turn-helix transcriptional regulator [Thermomicrobiales bacterium]
MIDSTITFQPRTDGTRTFFRTEANERIEAFAGRIREARQQAGLSQEELAVAIGFSSKAIYNTEARKRGPSIELYFALVSYFRARGIDLEGGAA